MTESPGRGAARAQPCSLLSRSPSCITGLGGFQSSPAGPGEGRSPGWVGGCPCPCPWGGCAVLGMMSPLRPHCCERRYYREPFIGALCTHPGLTVPFISPEKGRRGRLRAPWNWGCSCLLPLHGRYPRESWPLGPCSWRTGQPSCREGTPGPLDATWLEGHEGSRRRAPCA